jgi:hypothetical protein
MKEMYFKNLEEEKQSSQRLISLPFPGLQER